MGFIAGFSKRAQGQAWATDLIIAAVIFVLVVAIFYSLMSKEDKGGTEELEIEAKNLASQLDSSTSDGKYIIIKNGEIDEKNLQKIYGTDYEELKSDLQIKGEFCIFIEDSEGNLIPVDMPAEGEKLSMGNEALNVGNRPCGLAK